MKRKSDEILDRLEILFPNAGCELQFRNEFELLCAVILSAQTTDVSVNKVTPALFERYPDAASMALADPKELEPYIRSIGLYRNKAQSLFGMAKSLVKNHGGSVPSSFEKLTALPGVGRKTANVVSAEGFGIPALAVDTHVERVSKRLGLVEPDASTEATETVLKHKIKKDRWIKAHHLLIFFGRYLCKARNPLCDECPFRERCMYLKGKTK